MLAGHILKGPLTNTWHVMLFLRVVLQWPHSVKREASDAGSSGVLDSARSA